MISASHNPRTREKEEENFIAILFIGAAVVANQVPGFPFDVLYISTDGARKETTGKLLAAKVCLRVIQRHDKGRPIVCNQYS